MNDPDDRPLYDRIGGEERLGPLFDRLLARVLADPDLGPFFERMPADRLKSMQSEFLGAMFDGPMQSTGVGLSHIHAGLGITLEHYRRFADLFLETLREEGIDEADVNQVLDRLNIHADDIRGKASASG